MRCSRWEWRWWNLEKPRVAYGRRKELLLTGPLACCCRGAVRSLSPRVWWGCWATLPLRRRSLRHWRRFVQDKRKYSLFKIKWALRSKNLYSNNKVSPLYIRCKNVNFRVGESENPVRTVRNCTYFALFHIFPLEMNFDKDFSKLFSVLDVKGMHTMYGPYGHRKLIQSNTPVKTFCKLGNLCYQLLRGGIIFQWSRDWSGLGAPGKNSKNLCLKWV